MFAKRSDEDTYEEINAAELEGLTPELREAAMKDPNFLDMLKPNNLLAAARGLAAGEVVGAKEGLAILTAMLRDRPQATIASALSMRGPSPDYSEMAMRRMTDEFLAVWQKSNPAEQEYMGGMLGRLLGMDEGSGAPLDSVRLTADNFSASEGRLMMMRELKKAEAETPDEPIGYMLGNVKTGDIHVVAVTEDQAEELAGAAYGELHEHEDYMLQRLVNNGEADAAHQQVMSVARLRHLVRADALKAAAQGHARRAADEVAAAPLPETTAHAAQPNPLAEDAVSARVGDAMVAHMAEAPSFDSQDALHLFGARISSAFATPTAAEAPPRTAAERLAALRARKQPQDAVAQTPVHVPAFRLHTLSAGYAADQNPLRAGSPMEALRQRYGPARAQAIEDSLRAEVAKGLRRLDLSSARLEAHRNGDLKGENFALRPFYYDAATGADVERALTLHGPNQAGERTMQSLAQPMHFGYQLHLQKGARVRVGNARVPAPDHPLTFHALLVPGAKSSTLLIATPMDFAMHGETMAMRSHVTVPGTNAAGYMMSAHSSQAVGDMKIASQAHAIVMDE